MKNTKTTSSGNDAFKNGLDCRWIDAVTGALPLAARTRGGTEAQENPLCGLETPLQFTMITVELTRGRMPFLSQKVHLAEPNGGCRGESQPITLSYSR